MTWYLMQTKPRQEGVAEENVLRQGYGCFRPLCRVERVRQGRLISADDALFPGYVFVEATESQSLAPLRSTLGCRQLVRFGQRVAEVAPDLIEALRVRCASEAIVQRFKAGDRLRIVEGALAGVDGIFCQMDGQERVIVLLRLLQQQQSVSVPLVAVQGV